MKFLVSPHTHPESPISGSTVESMVDYAAKLGRTHFSYTDLAYMTSIYTGYLSAKKKGLKYIPGLEIFFRDPSCDIIKGSKAEKASYFKVTLYAKDQEGFKKLSEISSKQKENTADFYGESFPLLDWADLKECAEAGLLASSSDVHDIVGKHVVTETEDIGEKVFLKMRNLFGDRYFVSIVGNKTTHTWVSLVHFKTQSGREDAIPSNSRIVTNAARFAKAKELVENPKKHQYLKSYNKNFINFSIPDPGEKVTYAQIRSGFYKIPQGDVQLKANKYLYGLAEKYGVKVLYSDYSFYAEPEDKAVQDVRLSQDDIKEHTKRHMQTSEEAIDYLSSYMGLSPEASAKVLENNNDWAKAFDSFSLSYEYRLPAVPEGQKPLDICLSIIKDLGRLPKDDKRYIDRLMYEVSVLANNGKIDLTPYFLPIVDVFSFYNKNGRLTGPARGSAGGSLFMYLMGITNIDPIKYDLSFERFLSLERILGGDFPDVDVDLVDRTPLVGEDGQSGYLYERWGDKAAQISTRIQLRLKSSIRDVNKSLNGTIEPEIEKLSKALPTTPQGVSDQNFVFGFEDSDGNHIDGLIETNPDLQKYAQERVREWEIVQRCLGISRQNSKHASAFVISDVPIKSVLPVFMGNVTQYEAKAVEKAKLIKYDFLVVNQLKDIEGCIKLINKKNNIQNAETGVFRHGDKDLYIWNLPEEEEVFKSVWGGDTETLFQINTQSMIPFVSKIRPRSIIDLATILALVRPGPLDYVDPDTGLTMADEYVERREGRGTVKLPELYDLIPETFGVQVFQEQSSKVAREIGGMKPSDAEELRRAFSKKNKTKALSMKPLFMEGAVKKVGKDKAEMIWSQMETSSRYSFNKSHAAAYALITYACMYLKHHYPMEWWASVLTNADEEEISTTLFKHVRDRVTPPDINISTNQMSIDYKENKIRAKLGVLKGLGETVAEPIIKNAPYLDIKDFIRKKVAGPSLTKKLIHVGVMDSLFPSGSTLLQKMQAYEDAVEEVSYEEKVAAGKKAVLKKGKVDPEYMSIHPIKDFQLKKSILSTLPINLSDLVKKYSPLMNESNDNSMPMYSDNKGKPSRMISGDDLEQIEKRAPYEKSYYFCVPAYVIKTQEFAFSENTKKALKLFLDIDGKISERVMWPAWGENAPIYPKELKKGSVVMLFMGIREFKNESKIYDIKILA